MRFRFLGGLNCPDWVVFGVSKMVDYDFHSFSNLVKQIGEENFRDNDCLTHATVLFIIKSTKRFNATETLINELILLVY